MSWSNPTASQAIWRGLRRKCPQCGEGVLFRRWIVLRERCDSCGLALEGKPGDLWGFWVFTDRIFLFGAMIALYFGFRPESWVLRGTFLAIVVGALVASIPNRQGAFVAIDYLSRTRRRP